MGAERAAHKCGHFIYMCGWLVALRETRKIACIGKLYLMCTQWIIQAVTFTYISAVFHFIMFLMPCTFVNCYHFYLALF